MSRQIYECEIYNAAAPILGLRIHGDLECVCDTFDELDKFVARRSVNVDLETALAGFLRNAYARSYAQASGHLEDVYKCGYSVQLLVEPCSVARFLVNKGDGGGWDGLRLSLPKADSSVFGADLGSVLNACVFSCMQYEIEILNPETALLGIRMFGQQEIVSDSIDDLERFFAARTVNVELEMGLAEFLRAVYEKNCILGSRSLAKIYDCGYFVQLVSIVGLPTTLRVIKGHGGGWDGLRKSLSDFDTANSSNYLDDLLNICIFASDHLFLANAKDEIYEFEIYNVRRPTFRRIFGYNISRRLFGQDTSRPMFRVKTTQGSQLDCYFFKDLDSFFKQRAVNIELEASLAGFLRNAYEKDYAKASSHLAEVLKFGYSIELLLRPGLPTLFRAAPGDGSTWDGVRRSLPAPDTSVFGSDLERLLDACIFSCKQYEIDIYNTDAPLLGAKVFGQQEIVCDSLDDMDRFFGSRTVNVQLESALAGFLRAAYEMNFMLASRHLDKLYRCGYFVQLTSIAGLPTALRVTRGHGGGWVGLRESLFNLDLSIFAGGDLGKLLTACLVSCMHGLYGGGKHQESRAMADEFFARGFVNHVIEDIRIAQESYSNNSGNVHPLIRSLATGSDDYLEFFKGKTCNHPVSDCEIGTEGRVFVCCPSYLPTSVGNIFTAKSIDEIVHSKIAIQIRNSIKKQDFRFCRWLHCKEIDSLMSVESPKVKNDIYPIDFRLSYDTSCNLWCVTCRKEKITIKGEQREIMLKATENLVIPMLKKARSVTMNGYGDVFASKPCRQVLHQVNRKGNPELQINFITNAVLFTEEEWQKFQNIHEMVGTMRVSIDAASKATYDKIRLGGDWDVLLKNLKFLSRLRDEGVIKRFIICFVYQRENFREMAEFAQLGKEIKCDLVIFDALLNWNTYADEELAARSVHYPTNPLHSEFLQELERIRIVLPESANPQNVWLQQHGKRRTTLLSLDCRF